MCISIVNGYVCYSSCDEAKARHGEDPHKKLGEVEDDPAKPTKAGDPRDPAVLFGGSLSGNPVDASSAGQATAPQTQSNLVDLLV